MVIETRLIIETEISLFKSKLGDILGTTLLQKVSLRFFGGTAGGGGFTTTDSGPTG